MDGFRRVDWRRAQKTQSQLLEACGWPKNCRRAYRNNLAEALRWWRYCKSLIDHPELGPVKGSTGTDPASRQQALEEADADVEYRRRLLVNLAEA